MASKTPEHIRMEKGLIKCSFCGSWLDIQFGMGPNHVKDFYRKHRNCELPDPKDYSWLQRKDPANA